MHHFKMRMASAILSKNMKPLFGDVIPVHMIPKHLIDHRIRGCRTLEFL